MAITTMDGIVAALPGQSFMIQKASGPTLVTGSYYSLLAAVGMPGAGSLTLANTPNGAIPTDALTGVHPITDAAGGVSSYLGRLSAQMSQVGTLLLFDRLWHGGSYPLTPLGSTVIAPPALTRPDANGAGTELWLEMNVAAGAASTATLTYTNSTGVTGRTAVAVSMGSQPASRMLPVSLQAGDTGVRAVTDTLIGGTAGTGSYNILILRRLATIPITLANVAITLDAIALGMPNVYNDSSIFPVLLAGIATWPNPAIGYSVIQG